MAYSQENRNEETNLKKMSLEHTYQHAVNLIPKKRKKYSDLKQMTLEEIEQHAISLIPKKKKQKSSKSKSKGFVNAPRRDHFGMVIYNENKKSTKKTKFRKENITSVTATQQATSSSYETHSEHNIAESFLSDVLQQVEEMSKGELPDVQSSLIWQKRREQYESDMAGVREQVFSAFIETQMISENTLCCICTANRAVIRCMDCVPFPMLCEMCDNDVHSSFELHNRQLYYKGVLQAIPPHIAVENKDSHFSHKKIEKFCPAIPPLACRSCEVSSGGYDFVPHKACIFVNMKGRFDVNIPKFICKKCNSANEVTFIELVKSGLFPANANMSSGMYVFSQDLLAHFSLLRKEAPSLSAKAFISSYSILSEDHGRNTTISQTAFMDAVREWRYLQYGLICLQDVDPFSCPACNDNMQALHCDGNRKLYRYSNKRHNPKPNYYKDLFIANDGEVNDFVEKVTKIGIKDPGDRCGDSHWKAMRATSKSMGKLAETGLVMGCCRHNILYKGVNMFRGEIYAYPLFIQHSLQRPVEFICQDVVCKFWPYVQKLAAKIDEPSFTNLLHSKPFLSVMHAKAHSWRCQIQFGGRYQIGSALTSGEEMEQTNSYMSRTGFVTKTMTKAGREEEITEFAMAWNLKKIHGLSESLARRYLKVRKRLPLAESSLLEMMDFLEIDTKVVEVWKSEICELAKDKRDIDDSLGQAGKLYVCHLQKKEAEQLQTHSVEDLTLHPDEELLSVFNKKTNSLPKLKAYYKELLDILQINDVTEQDLLARGRDELIRHKMHSLQKKIEMTCQAIRQKQYDQHKSLDSGTKRAKVTSKLRVEKTTLDSYVKKYNDFVKAFPHVCKLLITCDMQNKQEWPWILHGETSLQDKKKVVELKNDVERLLEEERLLQREMQDVCNYNLRKIKCLQSGYVVPETNGDNSGKYFVSQNTPKTAIESARNTFSAKLKSSLRRTIALFKSCVEDLALEDVQMLLKDEDIQDVEECDSDDYQNDDSDDEDVSSDESQQIYE